MNGPAKLLYEVTGQNRASSWSFSGKRRVISFTGSNALRCQSSLQPIRLAQRHSKGHNIRQQGRSPVIHAISFEDKAYDVRLDLNLKAIMPPACRHNGNHITQAMKTKGSLRLNGETFSIDGFHSRDRSWAERRYEDIQKIQPIHWAVGIADENFAFHDLSYDDAEFHPEWAGKFELHDRNCLWGYVFENGETFGVVATKQHTRFAEGKTVPVYVEKTLEASNGKTYHIVGEAVASAQIQAWPNMCCHFVLMKWTINNGEKIAYGDIQVGIFRDAYRALTGKNG